MNLNTYRITSILVKERIKAVKIERKRLRDILWDHRIEYLFLPFLHKIFRIRKKIKSCN